MAQTSKQAVRGEKKKKIEHDREDVISWLSDEAKQAIWAIGLLFFAVLAVLAMWNAAGQLGKWLRQGLVSALGWGSWVFPILLFIIVYLVLIAKEYHRRWYHFWGAFLLLFGGVGLMHLLIPLEDGWPAIEQGRGGGYVGFAISFPMIRLMGVVASSIALLGMIAVGLILIFNTPLSVVLRPWLIIRQLRLWLSKLRGGNELSVVGADVIEQPHENKHVYSAKDGAMKTVTEQIAEVHQPKIVLPKIDIPLDLLNRSKDKPESGNIKENVDRIQKTLENFGIVVEMGEVHVGPTVSQYTLKPSEGVKLSQITALQNDLALALAAHPIRIEAPIPGKSLVGIEVPNKSIAIVALRDVLESTIFRQRKSPLTFALGQDVAGQSFVADLAKMPHMLIAGATGSGKSVCINTSLISLLYQNSPQDLKLVLVDPKRVELSVYNDIPHLLTPVITDVQKTINALKWLVSEMDRRYEVLSMGGRRNLEGYNVDKSAEERLPYIVVVIDELADLMSVAAREVEAMIIRLAQMARAVGIHLILATQRPSVNVITGLIKANITTRIAFSVASVVDSRTIIDSAGAEKLLGRGDMLFISAEFSKPRRAQCAYVSDDEVMRVVEFLRQKAAPQYVEDITVKHFNVSSEGVVLADGDIDDVLYEDAKRLIMKDQKASASFLQRRLRVGYSRAARLLDILEENGMIGPQIGSKPREVLVTGHEAEGFDVQEPVSMSSGYSESGGQDDI